MKNAKPSQLKRLIDFLFSPILRAQIVKEVLCTLRDPRSRMSLIVPPILQLVLFAFAVTLDVTNVNIGVLDMDGGRYSQEFVTTLNEAKFVGKLYIVHSQKELEDQIETGKTIASVNIPQGFSAKIIGGGTATAQVIIDGRRANSGQIVFSYIQAIVSNIGANAVPANRLQPSSIRFWFNPSLIYQWFTVPSLAAVLVTMTALGITSMSIARERELGTFDQLLVSPANYVEIIIAKTMPALIIAPIMGMMMVFAAIFLFGVPFKGNFLLLVLCIYVHIFAVVGIGLIISAISQTQQQAILGMFTIAVPMMLMSGFSTPTENMPLFMQYIAEAIPNKHTLLILQGSFLKGQGFADIFTNLWPLIVTGIVGLSAATIIVRNRLQ
jgi:ABC-2 type transport system permease protein